MTLLPPCDDCLQEPCICPALAAEEARCKPTPADAGKACGCGRPVRYETQTGMACNKYMRCPAPDDVMAKSIVEQVRPEDQDAVSHFVEWFCHKDTLECDGYPVSKGLARSLLARALGIRQTGDKAHAMLSTWNSRPQPDVEAVLEENAKLKEESARVNETLAILSDPDAMKQLYASAEDIKAGRVTDVKDLNLD